MENKEKSQPATRQSNKEETPQDSGKETRTSQTGTGPDTAITIDKKDNATANADVKANTNANANAENVEEPLQIETEVDPLDNFMRKYLMKKHYKYTTDEEIATALRDGFIYFMFLVMLTITCFSMHNYLFYHYQRALHIAFGKRSFVVEPTSTISFQDVRTKYDFWNFMEINFLSILHSMPRRPIANQTEIPECRSIFRVNHLLRPPHLLQVRVVAEPCDPSYYENFTICYPPYTTDVHDRTSTYKGSKYYDQKKLKSIDIKGTATNYEASGYIEHLFYDHNKSLNTIRRLRDIDWISLGTRMVMVQFVTFNQNANFFSLVRLQAEVLPCGFVIPKIFIGNVNMLSFFNQPKATLKVVFVTLYLFIIYYTIVELYEIRGVEWDEYFRSLRNIIDISILLICYIILLANIWHSKIIAYFKTHVVVGAERYQDMRSIEDLSVWQTFYVDLTAILIVISYLNFFKFIAFHRAMLMLIQIFKRSAVQLVTFTLVIIMVFMMFAFLGVLVFSSYNENFLYFSRSILTMARMITGDFDLSELLRANMFWAPLFLISYMCVVIFFMINIFIAIIHFNYIEIKSSPPPPETKFFKYIKNHFLNMLFYLHIIRTKPTEEQQAKKIDIQREEEYIESEKLPEDYIRHVDLPEDIDDELNSMNASLDAVERNLERFVKNIRRIERRL